MLGQTRPLPVSRLDTIGRVCMAMSQTGYVVYGGRVDVVEFKGQGLELNLGPLESPGLRACSCSRWEAVWEAGSGMGCSSAISGCVGCEGSTGGAGVCT